MALTKNKVTGLFSLILGVIYGLATSRIEIMATTDPIGPRVFPYIIAAGMILVGLALVLKKEVLTEKNKAVIVNMATDKAMVIRIGWTCLAGVIFGLILEPVGYLLSTFMFMTAMLFITYGARILFNCSIAALFALSTYGLFFGLLDVSLPRGILAF